MNRNIKLIRLNVALNPPQPGGGFVDRIVDAIVNGASSSINPTERE